MATTVASDVFEPNFTCSHSVVIDHPISTVFLMIATAEGHERVTRLSALCSDFALLQSDTISIPLSTPLARSHVRTLPSSSDKEDADPVRNLPRQFFRLQETVPILFGLIKTHVNLSGTLTWDEEAKTALYETQSDAGITVWKLREFREFEGKDGMSTIVSEKIEGRCSPWIQWIVQKEATKAHMCVAPSFWGIDFIKDLSGSTHMELYHTLF